MQFLLGRLVSLFVLFMLSLGTTLQAQPFEFNRDLVFVNAHLSGTAMGFKEVEIGTQMGAGLGVLLGYDFTPKLAGFMGLNGSFVSSSDLGRTPLLTHFDLGVQFAIGKMETMMPYGTVAYSRWWNTVDQGYGRLKTRGGGMTLGGGIKYPLSPLLDIDLGFVATFGGFSRATLDGLSREVDLDATAARLTAGVIWYPWRGQ